MLTYVHHALQHKVFNVTMFYCTSHYRGLMYEANQCTYLQMLFEILFTVANTEQNNTGQ